MTSKPTIQESTDVFNTHIGLVFKKVCREQRNRKNLGHYKTLGLRDMVLECIVDIAEDINKGAIEVTDFVSLKKVLDFRVRFKHYSILDPRTKQYQAYVSTEAIDFQDEAENYRHPSVEVQLTDKNNILNKIFTDPQFWIVKRHLEGVGFSDVGDELGITAEGARKRYYATINKIKKEFKTDLEEYFYN